MHLARKIATFIAIVVVVAGLCTAQTANSTDQATIQLLVQQVKELQEKVKALEAKQSSPAPAQAEVAAPTQPAEEHLDLARMGGNDMHEIHGIQWRGFGEFNYKGLDQKVPELGTFGFVPGSAANFYVGDFDLFLTSRINDKASVLAEIVIGEGDAQSFDVDLERVLFKYDFNDHLKMSFGRYHTGIGYYNTAFHSGKWLQTTADRPLIMEFANDGGLLPTQAVGLSMTGEIPSGPLGMNYIFEYGSSDTIRPEVDVADGEIDENNGNHVNLGVFFRPGSIPGLQVGGSVYHDKISDFNRGPSVRLGQTIANLHAVYTGKGIEFLNEGFLIRHAYEQSSLVYNTSAFYSQLSKGFGRYRPYVRYQYINANRNSLFEDVSLRHGPSFGLRYDFNNSLAMKAQFDHTIRTNLPDINGLQLQLAFAF